MVDAGQVMVVDLVETGVVAFVAFVFIGGSMAYFAGPPALDEFAPDAVPGLGCEGEACDVGPKPPRDRSADEAKDDDEDDDDGGERGKGKGKRAKD